MAWQTGVVCPCCLPLQLTATHFVHLRLHHHSSWFLRGSSGIASNVVVVTLIRKEVSQLPESTLPSMLALVSLSTHLFFPASWLQTSYKPVNVRGLQPVSPSIT